MNIADFFEKHHIDWKFIKFLFVGGLNTLFGYGILALFTFLNFHYTVSTFLATVLGILFNFKTTGSIVFKNHDNKLILKFIMVYGIVYVISISCLKGMLLLGSKNMYINYLILLLPCALLSFCLMKTMVFKTKEEKNEQN